MSIANNFFSKFKLSPIVQLYYYKFGSFPIQSNVKGGLAVYGLVARRQDFRASHWNADIFTTIPAQGICWKYTLK